MDITQDDLKPIYGNGAASKIEFDEHIKQVNFQLNNVIGYFDSGAAESAIIKAEYLVKAARELEDYLKDHCNSCKTGEQSY